MDKYDIFFAGLTLPDKDPVQVKKAVGKFFKIDGIKLDKLFSGKSIQVKSGVDVDSAGKYRAAFRKMGALVEISIASTPETAKVTTATVTETVPDKEVTTTQSSLADCAPPPAIMPATDLSSYSLAFTGDNLDDSQEFKAQQFDTSAIHLSVADDDFLVPDETIITAPLPDISSLSASPANTGTLEDCVEEKTPVEIPDISQMKLD